MDSNDYMESIGYRRLDDDEIIETYDQCCIGGESIFSAVPDAVGRKAKEMDELWGRFYRRYRYDLPVDDENRRIEAINKANDLASRFLLEDDQA